MVGSIKFLEKIVTDIWVVSLEGVVPSQRPTTALGRSIQALLGKENCQVDFIQIAKPAQNAVLPNNTQIPFDHTLSKEELLALPCKAGQFSESWPDLVLTAHQTVGGPIGLAVRQASGGHTKVVQVQGPNAAGAPAYDLDKFDVLIPQPHEVRASFEGRDNVLFTKLAIHDLTPEAQSIYRDQVANSPNPMKHPALGVFLGGNDESITLTSQNLSAFGKAVAEEAKRFAEVYVVPMFRTSPEQLQAFKAEVAASPNVLIDDKRFNYNQVRSSVDESITSCEGSLLGSEAAATGNPSSLYPYGKKIEALPLWTQGTWPTAVEEKKLGVYPDFGEHHAGTQEDLKNLSRAILQKVGIEPKQ